MPGGAGHGRGTGVAVAATIEIEAGVVEVLVAGSVQGRMGAAVDMDALVPFEIVRVVGQQVVLAGRQSEPATAATKGKQRQVTLVPAGADALVRNADTEMHGVFGRRSAVQHVGVIDSHLAASSGLQKAHARLTVEWHGPEQIGESVVVQTDKQGPRRLGRFAAHAEPVGQWMVDVGTLIEAHPKTERRPVHPVGNAQPEAEQRVGPGLFEQRFPDTRLDRALPAHPSGCPGPRVRPRCRADECVQRRPIGRKSGRADFDVSRYTMDVELVPDPVRIDRLVATGEADCHPGIEHYRYEIEAGAGRRMPVAGEGRQVRGDIACEPVVQRDIDERIRTPVQPDTQAQCGGKVGTEAIAGRQPRADECAGALLIHQ